MSIKFQTREEWLTEAAARIMPIIDDVEVDRDALPEVRVSVGWPGGRGKKSNVIGQCWAPAASADGVAEVFISPTLAREEPTKVLATLAHELCHAADRNESGHKGRFIKLAKGIGLTGKMTTTTAGEEMEEVLKEIASHLGDYPHGALLNVSPDGKESHPKQSSRMLKVECAQGSGYIVRMTRKWLDEYGTPSCPCHGDAMVEDEAAKG